VVTARWYNLFMRIALLTFVLMLINVFTLTSCSLENKDKQTSLSSQVTLLPYSNSTVASTFPPQMELTLTPPPTSEPLFYTVVGGDSLSVIALRFGIDLEELMDANPSVDPNAMSIGTRLIIPKAISSGGIQAASMTGLPTPVIQTTVAPDCYIMDIDEWICFLLVVNDQPYAVENVTGQIKISNTAINYSAMCPLDLIPAGVSLPLIAIVDQVDITLEHVSGSLTSAIPVSESDTRYGTVEFVSKKVDLSKDLRSAYVSGEILVPEGGTLRVLAYATDDQNHVAGYRIWESAAALAAGTMKTFTFRVYSLDGAISKVVLVAQARLQ
jgi:LysM repeat protein